MGTQEQTTTQPTPDVGVTEGSTNTSRDASPSMNSTEGSSSSSSSGSSNASLNPAAASFTPKSATLLPPPPIATRQYELRRSEGKGLGLFATSFIPSGTRVICEVPLLRIPENQLHLAWGPYCRLSNDEKKAFDALHFFKPENAKPEQASRLYLIDENDDSLDEEDKDELIKDQCRVMSTFACNNYQMGSKGLAVYETASRLNHSCAPNVHHSWNPTLNRFTVYTVHDIQAGEELCTTYLGGPGAYYIRAQRIELLRSNYGFTCHCTACADSTGQSENRRQLMGHIAYGLQTYQYGAQSPEEEIPYVPVNPFMALRQAEDLICMLIDEQVLSVELCKAYRMASTVALAAKNWEKARDYALDEADAEANCLGGDLEDLVKIGAAASCWMEQVRLKLVKAGFFQPEQKLRRRRFVPAAAKGPSKGQRKKEKTARARAEKAAAVLREQAGREAERVRREEEREAKVRAEAEEKKRVDYENSFPAL